MGFDGESDGPRKKRRISPPETGPYVLRPLLEDVPVSAEAGEVDASISCVEYWNGNLYVGTSLGEVLHFVSLPPDPSEDSTESSFMLASRLPISDTDRSASPESAPGIQQILVLPTANKACILCHGTVTFYTLPELSPTYGTTKVPNCKWIGGLDLNESNEEGSGVDPVVMIAVNNKIMVVEIGEERARRVRNIEFPGCVAGARRGTIACVADSFSYSLLEVEHRQKISLFPISSSASTFESGQIEDIPARTGTPTADMLSSSYGSSPPANGKGHGRSASMNTIIGGTDRREQMSPSGLRERSSSGAPASSTDPNSQGPPTPPAKNDDQGPAKPLPDIAVQEPGTGDSSPAQKPLPPPPKPPARLHPHIISPTSGEFLLVTGTERSEPGVGMFVNLDGEVVRGTMEFERYPDAIVIDGLNEVELQQPRDDDQAGYLLAIIPSEEDGKIRRYVEVQRWDADPGEKEREKSAISIPVDDTSDGASRVSIVRTVSSSQMVFEDISDIMRTVRLKSTSLGSPSFPSTPSDTPDPRTRASIEQVRKEKELFDSQETDSEGSKQPSRHSRHDWEVERNREEARFAKGLAKVNSSLILWSRNRIWRVLRNPLALQLDNTLRLAQPKKETDDRSATDRDSVLALLEGLRNMEPKTESEFLGLNYVRQKASLLLFLDLLAAKEDSERQSLIEATENALVAGGLDPRIVLLLVPLLKSEVLQGPQGIWIHKGLVNITEPLLNQAHGEKAADTNGLHGSILHMLKRYLQSWQKKRGYGSVTDEAYVFNSIDAALLHLLLEIDSKSIQDGTKADTRSARPDINKLVDNWKGDFGRAVELLESYHRLFVLSRLYQSRKMAKHVLATWRRIIEGEEDTGGEMTAAAVDAQVRKYLVRIRDTQLVEEYGSWLAARNPKLGVQVFADDSSRVKFDPPQVIKLLKARAPNSVQEYLEYLVFTKAYSQYADDLIAYYLDSVLSVLESSPEARASLAESYSTYRALRPPKPSYLSFITQNAPAEEWWTSRLRLLQLLGGGATSQYTSAQPPTNLSYSIPTVLARIEPFQNELVSESIILDGRQGRHREALRLLTHGLGDYDTAIRYCVFGGPAPTSTSTFPLPQIDTSKHPPPPDQTELFTHLLHEFLQITDPSVRIERTSDLLSRFASFYDVNDVLSLIPDEWSVDIVSEYLVRVLRGLVSETREARVQRSLSGGLYLKVGAEYIDESEKIGGWVADAEGVRGLKERRVEEAVGEEEEGEG